MRLLLHVFPFLVTFLACGYSFYGVYRFVSEWSAASRNTPPIIKENTSQHTTEYNNNNHEVHNTIQNVLTGGHWSFNSLSWTCSEKRVTNDFVTNQWYQFPEVDPIDCYQNEPDELEKFVLNMLVSIPFVERKNDNNNNIDRMFFCTNNNYQLRFITRQKPAESAPRVILAQIILQQDADHWFVLEFLPRTIQPPNAEQLQTYHPLPMPDDFETVCSRTNEQGIPIFLLHITSIGYSKEQLVTFWKSKGWNTKQYSNSREILFPIVCSKDKSMLGVKLFFTNQKINSVLVFDLNTKIVSGF